MADALRLVVRDCEADQVATQERWPAFPVPQPLGADSFHPGEHDQPEPGQSGGGVPPALALVGGGGLAQRAVRPLALELIAEVGAEVAAASVGYAR